MDHAIETSDLRPKSQRFRGNLLFEKRHLKDTPHLAHMSDSIVEEFEESAEE